MSQREQGLDAVALQQELLKLRQLTTKEVEESWAEITRLHDVCASKDAIIEDLQQQVQAQKEIIKCQQALEHPSVTSTNGSGPTSSSHHNRITQVDVIAQDQHLQKNISLNDSARSVFSIENITDSVHKRFSLDRIGALKIKKFAAEEAELSEKLREEREEELEMKLKQREQAISNLEQALLNQTRMVKRLREELDSAREEKNTDIFKEVSNKPDDRSAEMVSYPSLLMRRASSVEIEEK